MRFLKVAYYKLVGELSSIVDNDVHDVKRAPMIWTEFNSWLGPPGDSSSSRGSRAGVQEGITLPDDSSSTRGALRSGLDCDSSSATGGAAKGGTTPRGALHSSGAPKVLHPRQGELLPSCAHVFGKRWKRHPWRGAKPRSFCTGTRVQIRLQCCLLKLCLEILSPMYKRWSRAPGSSLI